MINSIGQFIMRSENVMQADVPSLAPGVFFIKTDQGEIVKWIRL
jgi:hypothetical protein